MINFELQRPQFVCLRKLVYIAYSNHSNGMIQKILSNSFNRRHIFNGEIKVSVLSCKIKNAVVWKNPVEQKLTAD